MPTKASYAPENVGPAVLAVKVGSTRVSVANAASTTSVGLVPSTRKAQHPVAQAAHQHAQADHAVADDHDRGEHGVAGQR